MNFVAVVGIIRRAWASIAFLTIIGGAVGLVASLTATPVYTATSQAFVSVSSASDNATDLLQGSSFTVRQVKTYTELVTSPRVLQPVIDELGLSDTSATLATRVTAQSPIDTVLINITVADGSPDLAASIADGIADSLATVVGELETPPDGGQPPVQLSTVRAATVPQSPTSPNLPLNVVLGLLIGVFIGVGTAILRELLDTKVRDVEDVEAVSEASVLGVIGYEQDAPNHPLIVQESPQSMRAEAFRRLRTNLQFLDVEGKTNAIVMTSALPAEGKTTTTINLAITLADAGQRVALVDADLRRPSIAMYMGVEGSVGLTTVLIGRAGVDDVVQSWGNGNLDVIASGQIPPNPSELLGSTKMAAFVEDLTSRYDVVLIDTSPLLPVTDGAILARLVGSAVVVVGAGTIHQVQLEDALETLATVNAKVLGMVVNRVPVRGGGAYAYSYYEYTSDEEPQPRSRAERRRGRRQPTHAGGLGGSRGRLAGTGRRREAERRRERLRTADVPEAGGPGADPRRDTEPHPPFQGAAPSRSEQEPPVPVRFPPVHAGQDGPTGPP
jgi:capsular exopolysaccharide synthesis family protein